MPLDPIYILTSTAWGVLYIITGIALWAFGSVLYNLLLHPLALQYPGPVLAQASVLYQVYYEVTGHISHKLADLHRKYGRVVRIAPNELSFEDSTAWQDIYGRGKHSAYNSFIKDPVTYGAGASGVPSILTCNDEDHKRFRKLLNHGFTSRAVTSQHELLQSYVDKVMRGLYDKSQQGSGIVDLALWYDAFGLDVISDLTYGQTFDCLAAKGSPTPETKLISTSLKASVWGRCLRRLPKPVQWIIHQVIGKELARKRQQGVRYSHRRIHERMQKDIERPDVFYFMNGSSDKGEMSANEIAASLAILMIAGSETTATTLAGCTYLLLRNPATFKRLQAEIVEQFRTEDEIALNKLTSLPFLSAVIDETLRVYPPTPGTLARRVPADGATISGRHIPRDTVVGMSHWVSHRSSKHFARATEFAPERWLGEDESFAADDKSAFRPFVLGPRNCIGQRLADAELRLVLARLVWNFNLELQDESQDWMTQRMFTLWEKPELKVKIIPRQVD